MAVFWWVGGGQGDFGARLRHDWSRERGQFSTPWCWSRHNVEHGDGVVATGLVKTARSDPEDQLAIPRKSDWQEFFDRCPRIHHWRSSDHPQS